VGVFRRVCWRGSSIWFSGQFLEEGEAFVMYYRKSSSVITPASLRKMMRRLGQPTTVNDCKAMIGKFDVNGDGVLDFEEWRVVDGGERPRGLSWKIAEVVILKGYTKQMEEKLGLCAINIVFQFFIQKGKMVIFLYSDIVFRNFTKQSYFILHYIKQSLSTILTSQPFCTKPFSNYQTAPMSLNLQASLMPSILIMSTG